jgi:carbamoyl-phosphate synthase large subunit
MPKTKGLTKVLIVGSGPIVIGQAAEFDYSGTQACRALREEGVEVVLLNPNPATIMTDREIADRVYLEPLTREVAEKIIQKERPQGLIATMGGQAGLNLAVELQEAGVLDRLNVKVLGTGVETIRRGEDRELFKKTMVALGQPVPTSMAVTSLNQIREAIENVGLPCVVRPAFTLGGTGGGFAKTPSELEACLERGLAASPVHQVLVEASLYGEKEIEFEVVRDGAGNAIAVCSMENVDPMGIHTGDSIVVAPALTLEDRLYQRLRTAALDIASGLGICGACNVQLALCHGSGDYYVIEVNPRVSRSSALASKATGYPIARVASKIALGFNLDEIVNEVTGKTTAAHEPAVDYISLKIPRWPWDKFPSGPRELGLQMKSTGEVMSIGRTFEEALGKGISSLDQKGTLWDLTGADGGNAARNSPLNRARNSAGDYSCASREEIRRRLSRPDDTRLFWVLQALREGLTPGEIAADTGIDRFFIERMARIVQLEKEITVHCAAPAEALADASLLRRAKRMGLSDLRIASLLEITENEVRAAREQGGVFPGFKMVDTCAGEFEARTPYYYSSYDGSSEVVRQNSVSGRSRTSRPPVVVLGGGPIRIGQGIEFDYCAVHAAWALEKEGYASVIINNNPETVSTDFNTAGRLYFEPLTFEHVMTVIDTEKPAGVLVGFGGQTAINLVEALDGAGVKILGTSPDAIDATEDRGRFVRLLHDLGIPAIPGTIAYTKKQALHACGIIRFPVVVRPSYVLGGRGMAIVQSEEELLGYFDEASGEARGHGVLIDKYILATEVEVDVVSDGVESYIPVILEHIERAGVHSGDSIAQVPPRTLSDEAKSKIVEYTQALCRALPVKGIANVQYIVDGDTVYCLELNPRASRTVPFVTKVTGFPMIRVATGLSLGRSLKSYGVSGGCGPDPKMCAVKMPVFSWSKMRVDPVLGPEMKSTGEVMGIGINLGEALLKSFTAQGVIGLTKGTGALLTIADRDKPGVLEVARALQASGWRLYATRGTAGFLADAGISAETVLKLSEQGQSGLRDIPSVIVSGDVQVVINTFTRGEREERDGFKIRALAVQRSVPVLTCLETAMALAKAASAGDGGGILAMQDLGV